MKRILAMTMVLAAAACSNSTDIEINSDQAVVDAPVELTLRVGEEKPVAGSVIRLSFMQVVNDSRCPIDAICVWEGNAAVEVGITVGTGPTVPFRINTSLDPTVARVGSVYITILELTPAPQSGVTTDPADYALKLRVSPT